MSTIFRLSINSLRRLSLVHRSSRSITRKLSPSSQYRLTHTLVPVLFLSEIAQRAHKNSKDNLRGHTMKILRMTVKSSVAAVPLAGPVVDVAFDALEDILEEHQEEIDQIAAKTLQEVQRLAVNGTDRIETALAVMESMKTFFDEIQAFRAKAGNTVGPLLEKASEEISGFAKLMGPEVKQEIDRRMTEVQSGLSQGYSSILRTVGNAAWSFKSSGKGDEKHTRNKSNSEEEEDSKIGGERK